MKPFHFSLESLRVLRQQKERAAQKKFSDALTACNEAEAQLELSATELSGIWNLLGRELGQGISADRLAALRTWCKVLEIRWNESKSLMDQMRQAAELALQEMTLAARNREALDRFYEKARSAHDRALQREEQKHFDELAVQLSGPSGLMQISGQKN